MILDAEPNNQLTQSFALPDVFCSLQSCALVVENHDFTAALVVASFAVC